MLRANLEDAALAAAKAWSHEHVEPRHLAYAIARRFRERAEVGDLLPKARAALDPHGSAHDPPALTDETDELLGAIDSDEDAIATLRGILGEGPLPAAKDDGGGKAVATEAEATPEPEPATGTPGETVAEVLAELDSLIGLGKVKAQVRSVMAVVQANQERAKAGLATVNPGLHLVFTGPPGTGKTTVARLMARLYAASGALPGSKFTEVGRSDLVAGYVGQTALKTAEVVRKTRPGVLFVDEAYALTPTHTSDYGAEAISTLVKAMEDHRDELAVIVAGYEYEMEQFLESNPGLRSRLKTVIDFPDYAPGELTEIFARFVDSAGLTVGEEALAKAKTLFRRAVQGTDFGNARFARSLFEQAYARMALRAAADGQVGLSELMELEPGDLEWTEPPERERGRHIGFGEQGEDEPVNEPPQS